MPRDKPDLDRWPRRPGSEAQATQAQKSPEDQKSADGRAKVPRPPERYRAGRDGEDREKMGHIKTPVPPYDAA